MVLDFDVQSAVMSLVRSSMLMNSLTKTLSRRDTNFESTGGCLALGMAFGMILFYINVRFKTFINLICKTKVGNSHIVLHYTSSLIKAL